MLEDSITSSPSKSNKSIREARLKRKNKRKNDQSAQQDNDHEQSAGIFKNLINEFYLDSETESTDIETKSKNFPCSVTKPPAIVNDFKPFELEKSLVMADRVQAQQYKPNIFPVTQGFVNCISLTESETKKKYLKKENECNNLSLSYNITESELLNCCHQAEKVFDNATNYNLDIVKPLSSELTPDKNYNMKLVNSILEDFSQSPLGEEQIETHTLWQYTPEFRLHRQPVKTYSRKRRNHIQCLQKHKKDSPGDEDDHSSCSSLSIQEDMTVSEKLNSLPTVTSNTQLLCENLLNLTEYFTQNHSHQNFSDEGQQDTEDIDLSTNNADNLKDFQNIPDLIKDILSLRTSYLYKKRYDSYNSTDSFYGFSNEEDKSYIIDAVSNDQEILNKNQNITYDINVSDNRLLDVSNKEDKPCLYDWPEDDYNDMFACINTENILQELTAMPHSGTENVETNATHNSEENNNKFFNSKISNQNPAFSNCIGFKTASSKPIKVSREAHIMAAKILSKLPEIPALKEKSELNNCDTKNIQKDLNPFENSEDYEWNDDCDLFLNIQTPIALRESTEAEPDHLLSAPKEEQDFPSTSKMATLSFKTVGGNNAHIPLKAQQTTRKLVDNFGSDLSNDYDFEEELKELKFKTYNKTHNLETKQSDSKQLETNLGFQTANGKNLTISTTAQKSVANILKEFCLESKQNYYEEDLEIMKQKINKKNNETKQSTTALNRILKETYPAQHSICNSKTLDTNNMDCNTANDKAIDTYSKAKQRKHKIIEEFNKNSEEENLIELKSLRKRNGEQTITDSNVNENNNDYTNTVLSKPPLEKLSGTDTKDEFKSLELENEERNSLNKQINIGFQTANGKAISISETAQQSVERIFKEFSAVLNIENHENDLKEMKMKIQNKNKELKLKTKNEDNEAANVTINECPSSSNNGNILNLTPNLINSKRKYSTDNSDSETLNETPSVKFFKNNLYCSKSSLAEQSLKSPLASAVQPVIMRKNLLTLTKRRKSKRNILTVPLEEIPKANNGMYDLNVNADTPNKSKMLLKAVDHSPASPNLKEFFSNAPLTSTPRVNNNNHKIPSAYEDSELKPISWEKNNDSISNKPSENTAINITLNSSNPSTKERIDRLKMYGKAPALSPILIETHHNCRPSGLRRTRSMLKKIEK